MDTQASLQQARKEAPERINALSWAIPAAGFAIVVGIVLVAFDTSLWPHRLGALVLAVTSALGIGALVGFLFGIPRALSNPTAEGRFGFSQNTNLEQVSDWLTKILVGVGLVEADHLARQLALVSAASAQAWGWTEEKHAVVAGFLLVASGLLGFLGTYIWTRTGFMIHLEENRNEVDQVIRERERAERAERERDEALAKEQDTNVKYKNTVDFLSGAPGVAIPDVEAASAESSARETGTARGETRRSTAEELERLYDSDPHRNAFGGASTQNGLTLGAEVQELTSDGSMFGIRLHVAGTPEAPLRDNVLFHLHPTFVPEVVEVAPVDGKAELRIVAEEAFTVGVEVANGTRLELDLNTLPSAPEAFRWDSAERRAARARRAIARGKTPP